MPSRNVDRSSTLESLAATWETNSTVAAIPPARQPVQKHFAQQSSILQRALHAAAEREMLAQLADALCVRDEFLEIICVPAAHDRTLIADDAFCIFKPPKCNGKLSAQLLACANAAGRHAETHVRVIGAESCVIAAIPAMHRDQVKCVIACAFSATNAINEKLLLLQLFAAHVALWHATKATAQPTNASVPTDWISELLGAMHDSLDVASACHVLANALSHRFDQSRVFVGLCEKNNTNCRVASVSNVDGFDLHSPLIRSVEAVMSEAVHRGEATSCSRENLESADDAHASLLDCVREKNAWTIPLASNQAERSRAILILSNAENSSCDTKKLSDFEIRLIALTLDAKQRLEPRAVSRLRRLTQGTWTYKKILTAICIAAALCALALPLPYKVACECQLEPEVRRFVAAPFAGTLETALVKPGDLVRAGEILARMDGREIRWERTSTYADQQQSIKKRDAAQAAHNYSEAQIAALEVQRLGIRLQLLDDRANSLEIKSPIDGIVMSGDLDRAQGAPLSIGQTLFEIAPLQNMVVEVAVPDDSVSRIRSGQAMTVRLDGLPGETQKLQVTRLQPRAEIRDSKNVFIAEAAVPNGQHQLRPGMKGRAKITTDREPLGWILFHRPWEFVERNFPW